MSKTNRSKEYKVKEDQSKKLNNNKKRVNKRDLLDYYLK